MEIINKLGIDVKLLIGQIVNFFILFFLLKKFVFKPLLGVLQKRKKMIEETIKDHQKVKDQLEKIEIERHKILSDASQKAMEVMVVAKKEAEKNKEKIMEESKKEIDVLKERHEEQLRIRKEQILQEITGRVADLIVSSCELILKREFATADQERIEKELTKQLATINYKESK